ncbi:MAG: TrkA family potassium uptake protein [Chloroflexi bacterium]|nr:TrkA family potassium uptake protein [Chloroflexota bacterium]
MKIVIMGCGRVGARLATMLDSEGHEVSILDKYTTSFARLPENFKGQALLGNGLDEEDLRKAGIEEANAFVAVTQADNSNIMAGQIAREIFGVKKVLCRIYDPLRRDVYAMLGLEAISPTSVVANLFKESLESEF